VFHAEDRDEESYIDTLEAKHDHCPFTIRLRALHPVLSFARLHVLLRRVIDVAVAKDDPSILKVNPFVRQFLAEMSAWYYRTSVQAVTHAFFGVMDGQTPNLLVLHRCWYFTNWGEVVKA
jgi:hypothetical protein